MNTEGRCARPRAITAARIVKWVEHGGLAGRRTRPKSVLLDGSARRRWWHGLAVCLTRRLARPHRLLLRRDRHASLREAPCPPRERAPHRRAARPHRRRAPRCCNRMRRGKRRTAACIRASSYSNAWKGRVARDLRAALPAGGAARDDRTPRRCPGVRQALHPGRPDAPAHVDAPRNRRRHRR